MSSATHWPSPKNREPDVHGRCRTGMTHTQPLRQLALRTLVASAAALTLVVAQSGGASAGGWAVGSLDEAPSGTAGTTEDVGFTILQHGQTPVDIDENVGIDIYAADGSHLFFEAAGDGTVGHYVASVTFPEAGQYTWEIRMGFFEPQPLGTLSLTAPAAPVVPPPTPTTTPAADDSLWSTLRWMLLGATIVLLLIAVGDMVIGRRRRANSVQPVQPA